MSFSNNKHFRWYRPFGGREWPSLIRTKTSEATIMIWGNVVKQYERDGITMRMLIISKRLYVVWEDRP